MKLDFEEQGFENITARVIKSETLRWVRHAARMQLMRNTHKALFRKKKPQGEGLVGPGKVLLKCKPVLQNCSVKGWTDLKLTQVKVQ